MNTVSNVQAVNSRSSINRNNHPSNWLEAIQGVKMSFYAAQQASRKGLKLVDIDLVMQYGEKVADGYLMTDRALSCARAELTEKKCYSALQRLEQLKHVVVVEIMNTIITTYRVKTVRRGRGDAAIENVTVRPLQNELALH